MFLSIKLARRSLARSPWFFASATGVLSIALLSVVVLFALTDGLLFRALPYPDAKSLWVVRGAFKTFPDAWLPAVSARDVSEWSETIPSGALASFSSQPLVLPGSPAPLIAAEVSSNFFEVLRREPLVGRFTDDLDDEDSRQAIISYSLWKERFGGDRKVIGTSLGLGIDAKRLDIVGILPQDFVFPTPDARSVPDVLLRQSSKLDRSLRNRTLTCLLRKPHALSLEAAKSVLENRTASIAAEFPRVLHREGLTPAQMRALGPFDTVRLTSLDEYLRKDERKRWVPVLASAGIVLLLAAVNITGLLLARLSQQRFVVALQRALGATSRHLSAPIVLEVFLIVVSSAAITAIVLPSAIHLLLLRLPPTVLLLQPLTIQWRVWAFLAGMSAMTVAIVSALPTALLCSRPSTSLDLSRRSLLGVLGRTTITLQACTCLVVLFSGAVTVGSLLRVWSEDLGFSASQLTLVELEIVAPEGSDVRTQAERLMTSLRRVPRVTAVGLASGGFLSATSGLDGLPFAPPSPVLAPIAGVPKRVSIDGEFFRALQSRLIAGRLPTTEELASNERVIVVSESLARTYWPSSAALGQHLEADAKSFEVVGVVADARYYAMDLGSEGEGYLPIGSYGRYPSLLTVFIRQESGELGRAEIVRSIGGNGATIKRVAQASEAFQETIRLRRFVAMILGTLGTAATAVMVLGIFGLVAVVTAQRSREIAIRLAIGATPMAVVREICFEHAFALGCGVALGTLFLPIVGYVLEPYAYKPTETYAVAWTTTIVGTAIFGMMGVLMPAFRAGRTQPADALRAN